MRTQKHRAVRYDHDRRYFSLHSIDSHTCDPDQGTQVSAKKRNNRPATNSAVIS